MTLAELELLRETWTFEAKAAQGRDGRGELPRSLWETYSAMANTDGGFLLLGLEEEKGGNLRPLGLQEPGRVLQQLWDGLNNRDTISHNLLSSTDTEIIEIEGKKLLQVHVPRAPRTDRPIFVGKNPLTGTFRRGFTGDHRADEATVRRMLAEATEESRDSRILMGFTLADIDSESLSSYRNLLRANTPDHPWLVLEEKELLRRLGGWRTDRQTQEEGLTLAGLLMFGALPSILEGVPHYVVDYQERDTPPSEIRWRDRVTTDGTWAGNLLEFYRRVYPRLTAGVKVPFRIASEGRRSDETHIHEALREALTNTLIHADFDGRVSILVVKRPDLFGFRNPGRMRVPVETALQGGESDCRNRNLQKMFQLIGIGEQAGSGIPRILRAWEEQHWRDPLLTEKPEPEQTLLSLPATSLIPPHAEAELAQRFGDRFRQLGESERIVLLVACLEEAVSNQRIQKLLGLHSSDVSALFRGLVAEGFLESESGGRWTLYRLKKYSSDVSPPNSDVSSDVSPPNSDVSSDAPDGFAALAPGIRQVLADLAAPIRQRQRVRSEIMRRVLLSLCYDDYRTPSFLAELLGRTPDALRQLYLNPLVREGALAYRYPHVPHHPQQAYKTVAGNLKQ